MIKLTCLQRLADLYLRSAAAIKKGKRDTRVSEERLRLNLSSERGLTGAGDKDCFITDQSKLGSLAYGRSDMSYAGCELIAIYNLAKHLGMDVSLSRLIYLAETSGAMLRNGRWGTNPYRIPELIRLAGIDEAYDPSGDGTAFILSFWNNRHIKSGIHTVFFAVDGDDLLAYNLHSASEPQRIRIEALGEHVRGGVVMRWPALAFSTC